MEGNGKLNRKINERMGRVGKILNLIKSTVLGKRVEPKNDV